MSCYSGYKIAKTGHIIPLFSDAKPSCSLYNPLRDAAQFCSLIENGTTLIAGYASGIHIEAAIQKFPHNKIIVVEKNVATIDYLRSALNIKFSNSITLCTIDTIEETLLAHYYPPKDGNFQFIPLRAWADANDESLSIIKENIQKALNAISQDISVQAHFGKIWQRNIIQNLQLCSSVKNGKLVDFFNSSFPTQKEAYIAGAGPSLENDFEILKNNREQFFVIATDTAYHALCEQDIHCDVVISVDAQAISRSHFMSKRNYETVFAFDLCANSTPIKKVINTNPVLFFKSNHPLCTYADLFANKATGQDYFPTIESSGGTVTLAALNFAKLAQFSTIRTGGCDFCYSKGKTYAKGIYMDAIFNAESTMFETSENNFCKILYRTPLIPLPDNSYTTDVLQIYSEAFNTFFENVILNTNNTNEYKISFMNTGFPTEDFFNFYKTNIDSLPSKNNFEKDDLFITLLPFLTWMSYKNKKSIENFENLIKRTIQVISLML